MIKMQRLSVLGMAMVVILVLAGCSAAHLPTGSGGSSGSGSPLILTLHDQPSNLSGMTVTSFEVTISGAVLEPGDVSLVSTPETVELTQLQTNSVFLSTTQVAAGSYTSLAVTYSSPQFTVTNNSGAAVPIPGGQCAASATCVVSNPSVANSTGTVSFSTPVTVSASNQTLVEFDVNLNTIVQSNLSLDFSQSAGATVAQTTNGSGTLSTIDTVEVAGEVTSVGANTFHITSTQGQTFTVATTAGTNATVFEFGRDNCAANDFQCVSTGQIVDVTLNLQSDGQTFDAAEVDFDDAANTQQVSGTIVGQTGSPPTAVEIVVHNTIPPVSTLPPGAVVNVTIGGSASYVVNNGSFVLPSGLNLSFASTSDVIIGQEVEARVESGTSISNGTPPSFTTDRLALEQTQLEAVVSQIDSTATPYPFFILNTLPALFSDAPVNATSQLVIEDTGSAQPSGTISYQEFNPSPGSINSLTLQQDVTVGGFLFNTTGSVGSPSVIATVVRAEVTGTSGT
jgi:hypothetical protein